MLTNDNLEKFKQTVENLYVKIKMDILLGKGKVAFQDIIDYNTNINRDEIFGIEKNLGEEMYDTLKEMVNKRKTEGKSFSEKDAMEIINTLRKKK